MLKAPKNLSVVSTADGTWLYFTTKSGKSAGVRVEALAQERGPIVCAALLEWCEDQARLDEGVDCVG